jgi:hypothetical protein
MSFCDLCNDLTITKLYPPNFCHHAESMAALEASEDNCPLCRMLYYSLNEGHEDPRARAGLTRKDIPELQFHGATSEYNPFDYHEARNKSSVKLQIIPGSWNKVEPTTGFTHIGIWMMSKWMVACVSLAVEEGTVSLLMIHCYVLTSIL